MPVSPALSLSLVVMSVSVVSYADSMNGLVMNGGVTGCDRCRCWGGGRGRVRGGSSNGGGEE